MVWQTADTLDLETTTWSPNASARATSTSRTDKSRTNEAITSHFVVLVLVGRAPNSRVAKARRAAQLRPGQGHRPGILLMRIRLEVAATHPPSGSTFLSSSSN
jgi:hypothetical protein